MAKHEDFLRGAMEAANPEWTVKDVREIAARFKFYYNRGIIEASQMALDWGNEAGDSGEGYKNLSAAINKKYVPE